MKKIVRLFMVLPFLMGCKDREYSGTKIVVEKDESGALTEVTPDVMYDVASVQKKDCVFYIGDDSCEACQKLKPQLEGWVKYYKGKIYYVNIASVTEENLHYLYDATVGYYEWSEGSSIPATYLFKEGSVVIRGYVDDTMNLINKFVTVEE